ncbi:MAG: family 16 glycosylhydrolase [Oscillochloris sp.]|nr:family 16 glycosylhydrolase [Oscillochloris sp.]
MMHKRNALMVFLFVGMLVVSLATPAALPVYAAGLPLVDDFETELPVGSDPNAIPVGWFNAQDGNSTVSFARSTNPPAARPGAPAGNGILETTMNVTAFGVVIHNFTNASADTWLTQDWSPYLGLSFWIYGAGTGSDLFIDVIDNRNTGSTSDDGERYSVSFKDDVAGWRQLQFPFDTFARKEIGNGAPSDGFTLTEIHGWAFGALSTGGNDRTWYIDDVELYGVAPVRPLTVGFGASAFSVGEGRGATVSVKLSRVSDELVTVRYASADGLATTGRDYLPASGELSFAPGVREQVFRVDTLDDGKWEGGETVLLSLSDAVGAELGGARTARIDIRDDETYDANLIDDFEREPNLYTATPQTRLRSYELAPDSSKALPDQVGYERVLRANRPGSSGYTISRPFAVSQDWSAAEGLSFWMYGRNSGKDLDIMLRDNRADDPHNDRWKLVWRDEFNGHAGSRPDPRYWSYEIGDGSVNGIPGWGNSELQYYTDSRKNVALDGKSNLVLTVRDASNSGLICYYGPCEYTSARLLSQHKFEFGYGRVEARIKVPAGAGLWPAFWSLGNNITEVGWPQTGEIDIMEFVGRDPNTIFGTIHGPGYSGGESYGNIYDVGEPVGNRYHVFTVEWQPDLIIWYIDGIEYHRATPADVAPNEWVFDHPFFLLLNMAVGGNFGGPVGADTTFPQSMLVDYVRVYAERDTAERFSASVKDDFRGWQKVNVPFSAFKRAKQQPSGAPNDGLTLNQIWGYDLKVPSGSRGPLLLDQLRLQLDCPDAVTVTSTADSGPGSLRQALADVCRGGVITFDPSLAGATISLASELNATTNLTIDGSAAPGLTLSGGDSVRVLVVEAGAAVTLRRLIISDGYGFQLGGALIVNGQLRLEQSIVEGSSSNGDFQFWQGGGGIYVGDGATLIARDSIVRNNSTTDSDGGGIYGFTGSLIILERSAVIGNTAGNVGGGLRTLGEAQIENSTISGNTSVAWHGGAVFHTDGLLRLTHSTVAANNAPAGTGGGIFVGTFGPNGAQVELLGSVLAGNSGDQCFRGFFGPGPITITSQGGNLASDGTCVLEAAGDQPGVDPLLAALADNGGPTLTHALSAGSPAIDAAAAATCPAVDQRGVSRPQGAGCDSGAFEQAP